MGDGALPLEKLYESQIDRHDRQHFEITFNYDISPVTTQEDGRARFRVDAFFFLPTNLGISAEVYGKDDFFKDVLSHLRFRTPTLAIETLADPLNPLSPLNILTFNLKQLTERSGLDDRLVESTINEAKLFGCILLSNWRDLRAEARSICSGLTEREPLTTEACDRVWEVCDRLEDEHGLLLKFRRLRQAYRENQASLPARVIEALRLVDEYLTYRFDEHVGKLHGAAASLGDAGRPMLAFMRGLGRQEGQYRSAEGFVQLAEDRPETLERYTYRTGALKKYLSQVLYLDVRTYREVRRFKGIIAGLGAGLAAFWSTLGDRNVNFRLHNVPTTTLIIIIVLVYIMKDQVKDLFKGYVTQQVQRFFPDQRLTIADPVTHLPIGDCRQSVRYTEKGKLAEDIRHVREFSHALDLDEERNEEVLSYHHTMCLEARRIQSTHARRMNVKHILRYSVANLLGQLSDPHVKVSRYNEQTGQYDAVHAPKVYHVNVVFRVAMVGPGGQLDQPVYHRLRAVLSKDGIERIEVVAQNKRLSDLRSAGPVVADPIITRWRAAEEEEDLSPS